MNVFTAGKRETKADETNIREQEHEAIKTTTSTTNVKTKGTVLLQTATATAVNDDGSRSTNVRILFDMGSQRSYMMNSLKTRLGLKPVKTETLHLNTFGEKGYRNQRCDVVALNLKTKTNDLIGISALNYPVICSPLPGKVNI